MSISARKNSSAKRGISNRFELYPAKSQPSIYLAIVLPTSLKVGSSLTSSSKIPCIALDSAGIGIPGLTRKVLVSSLPLGLTFTIAISTMRSFDTLRPVVSKSKNAIGFFKFKFIVTRSFEEVYFFTLSKH